MKLIIIYGPPASGKFTVGSELAKQLGYKLFHNHLTVPAAKAIFPNAHEPHHGAAYSELLKKIRLDVITAAAETDTNVIFTLAYSGTVDDLFIGQLVNVVASHGGTTCFVQLDAPDDILMERVVMPSRKEMAKIAYPQHLRQVLISRSMRDSVKYSNVLRLDTSYFSPKQACQKIIEYFKFASIL